jgi:hypothetical protein
LIFKAWDFERWNRGPERHFDRPKVDKIINERAEREIGRLCRAGKNITAIVRKLNRLSIPKGEALPLPGSPQVHDLWTHRDVRAAIKSFGDRRRGDIRPLRFCDAALDWMRRKIPPPPVSDEKQVFKGPIQIHIEYLEDRILYLEDIEQYEMMRVAEKERDKLLAGLSLQRQSRGQLVARWRAMSFKPCRPEIASSDNGRRLLPKDEITGPSSVKRLVEVFANVPFEDVLSRARKMQQTRDVVTTYAGFGSFKLFVNSATSEGSSRGKVLNPSGGRGYDPSDPQSASRGQAPRELRKLLDDRSNGKTHSHSHSEQLDQARALDTTDFMPRQTMNAPCLRIHGLS